MIFCNTLVDRIVSEALPAGAVAEPYALLRSSVSARLALSPSGDRVADDIAPSSSQALHPQSRAHNPANQ